MEVTDGIPNNDCVEKILNQLQNLENAIANIDTDKVAMPDIAKEYLNFKGKSVNLDNIAGTERRPSFSDSDSEDGFEQIVRE